MFLLFFGVRAKRGGGRRSRALPERSRSGGRREREVEGGARGRTLGSLAHFAAQPLQAAAEAGVEAEGADLQDAPAEQVGVDPAGCVHAAAARLFDLADD